MNQHVSTEPTPDALVVRPYRRTDEQGWLRCSVLSFLNTAYYDSVYRCKPQYDHPTIELVAELAGSIVGVIDVECEDTPNSVCTACAGDDGSRLGGMIWHLAVHPDFQQRGIGGALLREARWQATERGVRCFEAWTRDDAAILGWYESHGFSWVKSYLHVYLQGKDELEQAVASRVRGLRPITIFAHYSGPDTDAIRGRFERVHDCNCFRLDF